LSIKDICQGLKIYQRHLVNQRHLSIKDICQSIWSIKDICQGLTICLNATHLHFRGNNYQ